MVAQLNTLLIHILFAIVLNMVFNGGMDEKSTRIEQDRKVIASHGGPAKLARLLGLDEPGGTQRVSNWMRRGIPALIKLDHLDLFINEPSASHQTESA